MTDMTELENKVKISIDVVSVHRHLKIYAFNIEENGKNIITYSGFVNTSLIEEAYLFALEDALYFISNPNIQYNNLTICSDININDILTKNKYLINLKNSINKYLIKYTTIHICHLDESIKMILHAEIINRIKEIERRTPIKIQDTSNIHEVKTPNSIMVYWKNKCCGHIVQNRYISVRYPHHYCIKMKGWGIQKEIIEHLKKRGNIFYLIIDYHGKKRHILLLTTLQTFCENARIVTLRDEDGEQMFLSAYLWKRIIVKSPSDSLNPFSPYFSLVSLQTSLTNHFHSVTSSPIKNS